MSDLPDGTARVRLLHDSIRFSVDPDDAPDGVEPETTPGLRHNVTVTYEEGDEVPLHLAERCWSGFNDRLAAFDEDGNRLDTPSQVEQEDFDTALIRYQ